MQLRLCNVTGYKKGGTYMEFKLAKLNAFEQPLCNNIGLNGSLEEAQAKENPKMYEYFPTQKGWMFYQKTSLFGNDVVIIDKIDKLGVVEDVTPKLGIKLNNKIPGNLIKEILGSFNRIYKKWGTECAAQIYQKRDTGEFWIYYPEQEVSGALVKYDNDTNLGSLLKDNSLIMELHSHDSMGAFWSGTDNANETVLGLYMVIGNFNLDKVHYKLRCKYKSLVVDLKLEDVFDIGEESEDDVLTVANFEEGNPKIEEVASKPKYESVHSYTNPYYAGGAGTSSSSKYSGYSYGNLYDGSYYSGSIYDGYDDLDYSYWEDDTDYYGRKYTDHSTKKWKNTLRDKLTFGYDMVVDFLDHNPDITAISEDDNIFRYMNMDVERDNNGVFFWKGDPRWTRRLVDDSWVFIKEEGCNYEQANDYRYGANCELNDSIDCSFVLATGLEDAFNNIKNPNKRSKYLTGEQISKLLFASDYMLLSAVFNTDKDTLVMKLKEHGPLSIQAFVRLESVLAADTKELSEIDHLYGIKTFDDLLE